MHILDIYIKPSTREYKSPTMAISPKLNGTVSTVPLVQDGLGHFIAHSRTVLLLFIPGNGVQPTLQQYLPNCGLTGVGGAEDGGIGGAEDGGIWLILSYRLGIKIKKLQGNNY